MKALTLSPEYALAVAWGTKTIEYRTWYTHYRGDILIAANAKKIKGTIPSHVLCIAELYDIKPDEEEEGLYDWMLRNIRLIKPIPIKGKQSLYESGINLSDIEIIGTNDYLDSLPESEDDALFTRVWEPLFV